MSGRIITVMGIGNVIMSDDGWGPHVVAALSAGWRFPRRVRLLDAGTPGLGLVADLTITDALIVLDTVSPHGGRPGELRTYDRAALLDSGGAARASGHDPSLRDALRSLDALQAGPTEVLLIGAVPSVVEAGTALSPPLVHAVSGALQIVLSTLERWGVTPERRGAPGPDPLGWTRH